MCLAAPSNCEPFGSKASWTLAPATQQVLTSAAWRLPPTWAQGQSIGLCLRWGFAQCCHLLAWHGHGNTCLWLERLWKKWKVQECITQTKTAHIQISLGQPRPSLVFPARDTLRVLMTFCCSYSEGGTKPIPVLALVCLMVPVPQITSPCSAAVRKEASRKNCWCRATPGRPRPQQHPLGQRMMQVTTCSALVIQVFYVNVCKLSLHFRCFTSEPTELEPIRHWRPSRERGTLKVVHVRDTVWKLSFHLLEK